MCYVVVKIKMVISEHTDLKLSELLVNHCCYHVTDYDLSMFWCYTRLTIGRQGCSPIECSYKSGKYSFAG
jgi:hypothetical protein